MPEHDVLRRQRQRKQRRFVNIKHKSTVTVIRIHNIEFTMGQLWNYCYYYCHCYYYFERSVRSDRHSHNHNHKNEHIVNAKNIETSVKTLNDKKDGSSHLHLVTSSFQFESSTLFCPSFVTKYMSSVFCNQLKRHNRFLFGIQEQLSYCFRLKKINVNLHRQWRKSHSSDLDEIYELNRYSCCQIEKNKKKTVKSNRSYGLS